MSSTVYDQLLEAGAPELTGTDFYRITEHPCSNPDQTNLRIQIRRPRKHFGSDAKGTAWVLGANSPSTVSGALYDVVRACRRAYEDAEKRNGRKDAISLFVGEHS